MSIASVPQSVPQWRASPPNRPPQRLLARQRTADQAALRRPADSAAAHGYTCSSSA